MIRGRVGYVLKLGVGILILLIVATRVDLAAALDQLAAADLRYAAVAAALFLATHGVNAVKLGLLLPERSAASLFGYTLATQAYALLLPGQIAGEAVKAYRLSRLPGTAGMRIVCAVVVDKLTAIAAILLLTVAGLVAEHQRFGDGMLWLAGMMLAGLLAVTALFGWAPTQRWFGEIGERDGHGSAIRLWLGRRMVQFLEAWRSQAGQRQTVVLSLAYGLLSQGLAVAGSLLFAQALGIQLGLAAWCVVIGALSVLLLAPVTIGGIGLREASLVGLLMPFGVAPDRALALALALFAFQILMAAVGLAVDLLALKDA